VWFQSNTHHDPFSQLQSSQKVRFFTLPVEIRTFPNEFVSTRFLGTCLIMCAFATKQITTRKNAHARENPKVIVNNHQLPRLVNNHILKTLNPTASIKKSKKYEFWQGIPQFVHFLSYIPVKQTVTSIQNGKILDRTGKC